MARDRLAHVDGAASEVSKRWFRMGDTHGIEIAEDQNDALIPAVTVCIDRTHAAVPLATPLAKRLTVQG